MVIERSLVVIKPDGVVRSLVGEIISRFEKTVPKIVAMKMVWVDDKFAKEHYKLDEIWAKNVYDKTKKDARSRRSYFSSQRPYGIRSNDSGMERHVPAGRSCDCYGN